MMKARRLHLLTSITLTLNGLLEITRSEGTKDSFGMAVPV